GDAVAAEPVGTVGAACVLTGHQQTVHFGPAVTVDDHPAHVEVRRGRDENRPRGEILADLPGPGHHAGEPLLDLVRTEVRDVDVDPALGGAAAGHDLQVAGPRHDVAGRPLPPFGIV